MSLLGLALPVMLTLACQLALASNEAGREAFEPCLACHSLAPGMTGMAGPSLAGLASRPVGGDPGFDYSESLRAARAGGLMWSEGRLELFLAGPGDMFPGTWMSDPGVRDPARRVALARYLMRSETTSASPR